MSPAPSPSRVEVFFGSLLGLLAGWVLTQRLSWAHFSYLMWADRDLLRGTHFFSEWPSTGAELSYGSGARIPGGFLYLLMGAAQALHDDPRSVMRLALLLDTFAVTIVAWLAWRLRGPMAAGFAACLYLGTPVLQEQLGQLWNPAFTTLFVALSLGLAQVAVVRRQPLVMGVVAWVAALGAQAHLTVGLWGALLLLTCLAWSPRQAGRGMAWAIAGTTLAYLPHLIDELRLGFPNTRLMLEQTPVQGVTLRSLGQSLADSWPLIEAFSLRPTDDPSTLWTIARWLPFPLAAAGIAAALRRRQRPLWRLPASLGAILVGVGALLILSPHIFGMVRYLGILLPAFVWLAAVGAVSTVRLGGAQHPITGAALASLLTLAVGRAAIDALPARGGHQWSALKHDLSQVRDRLQTDAAGVVGRYLHLRGDPSDGANWAAVHGVEYWLHQQGTRFQGSQPPPCAFKVSRAPDDPPPDAEWIAELLELPASSVTILEHHLLQPGEHLLIYAPQTLPLCPTSMLNRYVTTSEEALLIHRWPTFPIDRAERLSTTRWGLALRASSDAPLRAAVLLEIDPSGHTTLHSHQLRGNAHLEGWFATTMLHRPRIRLRERTSGDEVVQELYQGWLGHRLAAPPIRATLDWPSGSWEAWFEAEATEPLDAMRWPVDRTTQTFRIELPCDHDCPWPSGEP